MTFYKLNNLIESYQEGKYEWSGSRESGDCSIKVYSADIVYDDGKALYDVTIEYFIIYLAFVQIVINISTPL